MAVPAHRDQDLAKGAVEGTRPSEPHHSNANAPALDDDGCPEDLIAISEDVIGANEDGTEG